jgi:fibronectin type 3 domain-containing protein
MRTARSALRRRWSFEQLESRTLLSANVLTYHNEQAFGVNSQETQLTPTTVNASQFAKRYATVVDGQIYAQPLYVSDVTITTGPSPGHYRVVYAATEHNSVYAIDSDSGAVLWRTSFIDPAAGITTMPAGETGSGDITTEIGITATPVIDLANNVMYVEAKTKEVRSGDAHPTHYVQKLHRVSLSDGSYTSITIADTAYSGGVYYYRQGLDPYTINDRTLGNADGAIPVGGQYRVYFNAMRQLVRPGLVIHNGSLYIESASHGDNGPYHGWVLKYDITGPTPVLSGVLNTTPNGGLGGIWQGGGVLSFDPEGNFYFETGNGTFSPYRVGNQVFGLDAQGFPVDGNYGDSFVKVGPDTVKNSPTNQNKNGWGLKVLDYFTPFNEQPLDAADRDLGSAAPIVLPDSLGSAAHPHLLIGSGKEGKLYLIDRDNMGKSDPGYNQSGVYQNAGTDHVVQTVAGSTSGLLNTPALANIGTAASPVYRLFLVPGYGGNVRAYAIANGVVSNAPVSESNDGSYGYLSGSPSISQNGTTNSILWTIERNTNQLRAYNAQNLSQSLYTSGQSGNRDQFVGTSQKFSVPTVADGRVFVGTSNALLIYGPPIPPTAPPEAPTGLVATAPFPTQILLNWTDNSSNEDLFSIERSSDGVNGWTEIGQAGVNTPWFTDDTVAPNSTFFYRLRAYNSFNGGSYSAYTNVASATTSPNPVGAGDGVQAVYYNNIDFTGATVRRIDPQINFDWGNGSPVPGPIAADTFSAVWTGVVRPQFSEAYTFYTTSDDGVRLFVNGEPVIDNFTDHAPTENASPPIVLAAGQTYPIRMEFYENGGGAVAQLRWSSTRTPKGFIPQSALYSGAAPAAPSGLTAVAASGTQINLSWADNSAVETGFKIERKQGANGAYEQIAIAAPNATSFMDSGLLADTTYYYRIRAGNFGSDSAYSNEAGATTPVPPKTPSDAHPTAVTKDTISFAWTDNSNNEDKFSIFRKTGTNGAFIFVADVPANTTSYVDSGRSPGTFYDYHIQAANLGGYTDFAGFSVTTITDPPADLAASGANTQVTLSWTASLGADSYNVYRGTSPGGEGATPIATGVTDTAYVDNMVAGGATYYYVVSAVTTGGESAISTEVSATALPNVVIQGTPGNDQILVIRSGSELHVFVNAEASGEPTYRVPLAGLETLNIDAGDGDDTLAVHSGGEDTIGIAQLVFDSGAGMNNLVLQSGSARIDSTAAAGTLNTTVDAGAHLTTSRFAQNVLSLANNSRATVLPDSQTSVLTALNLAAGATLDIGNNALVIDYSGASPLAMVREQIASGRGGTGFGASWNGSGISSSAAAGTNQSEPESRSVGYAENAALPLGAYTEFRGVPVDTTAVLVAFTRTGDATLDGLVNDDDVTVLGASYAPATAGADWSFADFDYNGFVDDDDATLLGAFYNPLAEASLAPTSKVAANSSDYTRQRASIDENAIIELVANAMAEQRRKSVYLDSATQVPDHRRTPADFDWAEW